VATGVYPHRMTRVLLAATILLSGCDGSDLKLPAPDPPPSQPPVQIGVDDLVSPKLITTVQPRWPEAAKRLGLTGPVLLSVRIDEAGNVADVRVVRGHPALNSAAEDAVKRWKYQAMLFRGQPISFWTTVMVKFRNK
jgi:TonB family protein